MGWSLVVLQEAEKISYIDCYQLARLQYLGPWKCLMYLTAVLLFVEKVTVDAGQRHKGHVI